MTDIEIFFKAVKLAGIPLPSAPIPKIHKPKLKRKKKKPFCKSDYSQQIKMRMIKAYGGQCACCSENYPDFMTIDHIFGDGKEDRKKIGSGLSFYRYLEKNGYPKDRYRLLCMNCNFARRFGKDCPHNTELNYRRVRIRGKHANSTLPWPEIVFQTTEWPYFSKN